MSLFDLTDEVAVVIGATGALGGACAVAMAEAGAKIAVVGRSAERGEARVQEITEAGGTAQFFTCDAMSPDSLKTCHEAVTETLGAPSVLLNAAGGNDPDATVTPEMPFENIPLPAWAKVFDLNLVGGLLLPCQEFGPAMCERGKGSIINIASVLAVMAQTGQATYCASKAAVAHLTNVMSLDLMRHNIRVNAIAPGWFLTEMNEDFFATMNQ